MDKYISSTGYNALDDIKSSDDIGELIEKLDGIFGAQLDYTNDVILPWLVYSEEIKELDPSQRNTYLYGIEVSLNIPINLTDFYEKDSKEFKKKFELDLKKSEEEAQQTKDLEDEDVSGVDISPFTIQKINRVLSLTSSGAPLVVPSADFLLDQIRCSDEVPIARTAKFTKIYTAISTTVDAPASSGMNVKLASGQTFFFFVGEDTVNLFYELEIKTVEEEKQLVNTALSIFPMTIKYTVDESRMNGIFFIRDMVLVFPIWVDLCFTDILIAKFITVNEREKATRLRSSSMWMSFAGSDGLVTFSVTNKNSFLRVKISRADSLKSIEAFQRTFAQLLTRYEKKKQEVVFFYRNFLPDFGEEQEENVIVPDSRKKQLKEIAPELFRPIYTRKCANPPIILDEKDASEMNENTVMLFPKTSQEGPQYYFHCPSPNAPFPGLMKNTMDNKNEYPYVPCCYVVDQRAKTNSAYNAYYSEEGERDDTANVISRIILTNKFVKQGQLGVVPDTLVTLLEGFTGVPVSINRTGVSEKAESSFLACVLDILGSQADVAEERERLADQPLILCKQEWYDKPIDLLRQLILDDNEYLDPRYVIRLVEHVYNVKCVVFTKDRRGVLDILRLPYEKLHVDYEPSEERELVVLYEHWGSEANMASMPRCEILSFSSPEGLAIPSIALAKLTDQVFYVDSVQVEPYYLDEKILSRAEAQHIDQYGKMRGINIPEATIFTTPLPPLALPETTRVITPDARITIEGVYDLREDGGDRLSGICGNVRVYIPLDRSRLDTQSELSEFIRVKKLARYLEEVSRFLLSKELHDRGVTGDRWVDDMEIYENFQSNFIRISNKTIEPTLQFDENLTTVYVKDDETSNRLVFSLMRFSIQNPVMLLRYHELDFIPKDFATITDFESMDKNLILVS